MVVVTVRPFESVEEETARAVPLEPLDEDDEEAADADKFEEERPEPVRERTLTELPVPKADEREETATPFGMTPFTCRPSGKIRVIVHFPVGLPTRAAWPAPPTENAASPDMKRADKRAMTDLPIMERCGPR